MEPEHFTAGDVVTSNNPLDYWKAAIIESLMNDFVGKMDVIIEAFCHSAESIIKSSNFRESRAPNSADLPSMIKNVSTSGGSSSCSGSINETRRKFLG